MSGTALGGERAAATNKAKHGKDFYKRIGALGGRAGRGPNYTGGFAGDRELASRAGRLGGVKSRRKKTLRKEVNDEKE